MTSPSLTGVYRKELAPTDHHRDGTRICPKESTYLQVAKEIQNSGSMFKWQPPTRAVLVSPSLRLWQAKCIATILDEHAVSEVKLGPLRSKK